jgi:menaquinone-dependent protoporphyrinogen IX oxidase
MHAIVVYRSKTGCARRYAGWIAEELGADLYEASRCGIERIAQYDAVVYGGGLYAAGINGVKLITNNLDRLRGKKVAVFATGASPPHEEAIRDVTEKNFTNEQLESLCFFYLRGGFDYKKLGAPDRFLMSLLRLRLKAKKHPTADERGLLAAYDHPVDFVKRQNIAPLVEYIKSQDTTSL